MEKKDKKIVILTFFVCLSLSLALICQIEKDKLEEKITRTEYVTDSQVSKLQYILDTLLLKTQTLEMIVVENNGEIHNFNLIAEKLYDNQAIRSLQLAPDGIVQYVYPLAGNEEAFVDLFSDPDRATEAIAARDSGELTLSGPLELYQGGLGIVGRRPIYLTDEHGSKDFWGFSIILLDLPAAFYPARLDIFVKEGFDYKLYRINPDTQQVQIIDQSSEQTLKKPVEVSFPVPNGTWTFSVMPRLGWVRKREIAAEAALASVVTLLVTFISAFIIKLKRQKETLYRISTTDSLTGLYNYSLFMSVLEEHFRKGKPFLLFFMDLDQFKSINDTLGHNAGNQVLVESARRLSVCFSGDGTVFRTGGDEFCAILTGAKPEAFGADRAKQIEEFFSAPFSAEGHTLQCGISVGYAAYPADSADMECLIQKADQRMYLMKKERSRP